MAKRKQQNVELERQLKQRKMIFRMISILVAAVIVFAIGFGIWTVQDSRWVFRYDGGRVSANDFRAVFDIHWQSNPQARDIALQNLQQIVTLHDRAEYHGVDFTPEEREQAIQDANWEIRMERTFQWGFDPFTYISDERLAELFFIGPLIERLMDIYIPAANVTYDEEEFAQLLEVYLEEELHRHLDLQVMPLILETREEIEEAYSLIGTMGFDEIIHQFIPGIDEDDELTMSAVDLAAWMEHQPEDMEYILDMQPGDYTRIIVLTDEWDEEFSLYMLLHAVSRVEPDAAAAEANFREEHIEEIRGDIFSTMLLEWVDEANFRLNRRGYNAVA